ncbi:MAG: dihydrofolate reductase family protein, partial [Clostridia bacterium]|nr:dihydrofolate reductase family protein [Clostridia bacterium]
MNRPKVICHMLMSIDGKVTGDFLYKPECEYATEKYYKINRNYKADAFACGRVTMERSFTNGWYPDLSEYEASEVTKEDYITDELCGFYAVAFDRRGRLGWKINCIEDDDPGYGGAQIIEVLCENNTDVRYLKYLREKKISYIFAGKDKMEITAALAKLKNIFGIETLLLEGGSIINGAFQQEGAIDELSLVTVPVVAASD